MCVFVVVNIKTHACSGLVTENFTIYYFGLVYLLTRFQVSLTSIRELSILIFFPGNKEINP